MGVALVIAMVLMFINVLSPSPTTASTDYNGYQGTTTQAQFQQQFSQIKTGNGTLAQVTITAAAAAEFNLIDATTTDVNKRTNNAATSSLILASFPASVAVGTYTFDRLFFNGLLLVNNSSTIFATTTITYR